MDYGPDGPGDYAPSVLWITLAGLAVDYGPDGPGDYAPSVLWITLAGLAVDYGLRRCGFPSTSCSGASIRSLRMLWIRGLGRRFLS